MTFPSKAYLGCMIVADVKKNEYFCQLVGPGMILERKVLASAFGRGKEEALANAMSIAGVDEISEVPDYRYHSSWYEQSKGSVDATPQRGLVKTMKILEDELEKLAASLNPPVQLDFGI